MGTLRLQAREDVREEKAEALNQAGETEKEAVINELRSAIQEKKEEVKGGENGPAYALILTDFEKLLQGTTEEICKKFQLVYPAQEVSELSAEQVAGVRKQKLEKVKNQFDDRMMQFAQEAHCAMNLSQEGERWILKYERALQAKQGIYQKLSDQKKQAEQSGLDETELVEALRLIDEAMQGLAGQITTMGEAVLFIKQQAEKWNQAEEGKKKATVEELRAAIQAKKRELAERAGDSSMYTSILTDFETLLQGTPEEICKKLNPAQEVSVPSAESK